ncbi:hypothetical protein KW797_01325 [Candidatus Parcubacteria bacterium]|nr:hypothetical protein [Candidatus Parcubacteria bacterium]
MTFGRLFFLSALFLALALPAYAAENGEITISRAGKVSIKNAQVFQKAGSNFYTRVYWENVFLRVTVVTNSGTVMEKRHGEKASVDDIKEGDYLDIEGSFPSSSESFVINASYIVNSSLEKESLETHGTIVAVFPDRDEFTMRTWRGTLITVTVNGAAMKKGVISIGSAKLKAGDKVTSASGTYDFATKVLAAARVDIYQDPGAFSPHNFQGKIKSMEGTTLPTTMVVSLTSKEYTVRLSPSTKILKNNKQPTTLSRFELGDTVRLYGAVREDDLSVVDGVELIRDFDL